MLFSSYPIALLTSLSFRYSSNVPCPTTCTALDRMADLESSTKTEDKVKSGLLLNVVVTQGTAILELLSGKDQTLLIRRDSFLVLNLGLDVVDSVRRLNVEGDGLSSQGLDKDLHTSTKTEDEVESGLLLDVVVTQGTTILELLTSKDQTLLIRRDSFLVLDLGLNVVNGIRRLDIKSDGLSSQGLDKDLCVRMKRIRLMTVPTVSETCFTRKHQFISTRFLCLYPCPPDRHSPQPAASPAIPNHHCQYSLA